MKLLLLGLAFISSAFSATYECTLEDGNIEFISVDTQNEVVLEARDFDGSPVNFEGYQVTTRSFQTGEYFGFVFIQLTNNFDALNYQLHLTRINSDAEVDADYTIMLSSINSGDSGITVGKGFCSEN
jgi:hypothetical protein